MTQLSEGELQVVLSVVMVGRLSADLVYKPSLSLSIGNYKYCKKDK